MQTTKVELACKECGISFLVYPCNQNITRFCSWDCHKSFLKKHGRPEMRGKRQEWNEGRIPWNKGLKELNSVDIECPKCGTIKRRTLGWLNTHNNFCSYPCYVEYLKTKPEKNPRRLGNYGLCEHCGKEFYIPPHRAKNNRYCSMTCYGNSDFKKKLLQKIPHTETEMHIQLKNEAIMVLELLGYNISLERWITIDGKHYRIDVYGTRGDEKILIECGQCPKKKLDNLKTMFENVIHVPYGKEETLKELK